jgi:hypothetical protein
MLKYRFQWTFPVEISPHDPDALYICSNHVHRSTDEGASWDVISPDLTRNDPTTLQPSGGPITADNSGAEIYGTIFAFRESPHEPGVFWAGSDDGLVHLSRDGGASWRNVSPPDLPPWSLVSIIEASPHDPATVYLAATRYKLDDTRPYLFKTNDHGVTWTKITNGIPDGEFTRVIREDPGRPGLLYAGTETGLYLSLDAGANWQRFEGNLPVVPIHDLVVKDTDLVVGTHGRSFWILDDLTPLHQLDDAIVQQPVHLFAPRPTVRYRVYSRGNGRQVGGYVNYKMTGPVTVAFQPVETATGAKREAFLDAGQNPPEGVILLYWLRDKPVGEVKLAILDGDGMVIREYSSASARPPRLPIQPGLNRFVWDLSYAGPTPLEDRPGIDPDRAQQEAVSTSPRAIPGTYQVRLTVGDASSTQSLVLLPDPRLPVTAADLAAQFELKLAIRDRLSAVHAMLNQIQRVRRQIDEWESRVKATNGNPDVLASAAAVADRLAALEADLLQVNADKPQPGTTRLKERLAGLSAMIDESDHPPTRGAIEVFASLGAAVETAQAALRRLLADDLSRFGDLLRTAGIPPIVP